jgi:flagellar assembly protein FliH
MMNISFNEAVIEGFPIPATSFLYRDMGTSVLANAKITRKPDGAAGRDGEKQAAPSPSAQEINDLLIRARIEAAAETEKRLSGEYIARSDGEAAKILQALALFESERKGYFSRIESEVVHLALAIAAKVLHREAQVDPLLVAALVRVAVDRLHDGSSVSVRVPTAKAEKWRERLANPLNGSTIAIVEDAHLGPDDCILETDVGSANFSIDAQLKEVEQGFFDLLAQRPPVK